MVERVVISQHLDKSGKNFRLHDFG